MASVESVNVGVVRTLTPETGPTGIDKRPVAGPVFVRAPGPKKGVSGLVTDQIVSARHHGGNDQAVYAYAREDLDVWAVELDRTMDAGVFGENLTTLGLDVNGALVGERWAIGDELVLQVTEPRIPCSTFAARMALPRWIHRFTRHAVPGAYLRVLRPGPVRAGDPIVVTDRPDHDVTIGVFFRAFTLEPELLPRLLVVPDLSDEVHATVTRRTLTRS